MFFAILPSLQKFPPHKNKTHMTLLRNYEQNRENYPHVKGLANLLVKFSPCKNNHVKSNDNQFDTCIAVCADYIHMPRLCKSLNHSSLIVSVAEWSWAPVWKVKGHWFDSHWRHIFSFWIFCLLPVPYSSAEPKHDHSPVVYVGFKPQIQLYEAYA